MHDLVLNDESIFIDNPTCVRKTFGEQMSFTDRMF